MLSHLAPLLSAFQRHDAELSNSPAGEDQSQRRTLAHALLRCSIYACILLWPCIAFCRNMIIEIPSDILEASTPYLYPIYFLGVLLWLGGHFLGGRKLLSDISAMCLIWTALVLILCSWSRSGT